jgi:hypothetical protein
MKKLLSILIVLGGIGAYLHYVRGWTWQDVKEEAVSQATFYKKDESATTTPIGQWGEGTHWETAKPMPTPRSEIGAALIDGKIYVVGGLDGYARTSRAVEVYDIETDAWSTAPLMPQALHHPAVTTDGKKLYVIGGYVGIGFTQTDQAYIYDPTIKGWSEMPRLEEFRGAAGAAFIDGRIFAVGGTDQSGPTASMIVYDTTTGQWNDGRLMPTPREHHAVSAVGSELFAVGGRQGGFDFNLDTAESYDVRTGKWKSLSKMTLKRGGIASAAQDGKLYVFGGEAREGTFDDVEIYDLKTQTWKLMHLKMPTARHGLAAVTYKNRIYVIGGGKRPGYSVSSLNEVLIIAQR